MFWAGGARAGHPYLIRSSFSTAGWAGRAGCERILKASLDPPGCRQTFVLPHVDEMLAVLMASRQEEQHHSFRV